ncbi:hypothetical protein AVEN_270291-1 [Araneus ventricosus]|uniref:Uncharacterized protein n=1 Tax=Araneus ventricosus TaxID=182803 RepID=A0A4Y2WWU0_ARAVE|nr:hypothetical protein AVEN_270291-1 [Araneus ventricosus]
MATLEITRKLRTYKRGSQPVAAQYSQEWLSRHKKPTIQSQPVVRVFLGVLKIKVGNGGDKKAYWIKNDRILFPPSPLKNKIEICAYSAYSLPSPIAYSRNKKKKDTCFQFYKTKLHKRSSRVVLKFSST